MAPAEHTAPSRRRFHVHLREEGRSHAHPVPGAQTLEDAALRFAEQGGAGTGREVHVVAVDAETGETRCFCLDLDLGAGEREPCG